MQEEHGEAPGVILESAGSPLPGPEGMAKRLSITGVQEADVGTVFCPAEHQQSASSSKEASGELDDSPVLRAIARHLGIDISPESREAQNRQGIAIIIHGAPLTGACATWGRRSRARGILVGCHVKSGVCGSARV